MDKMQRVHLETYMTVGQAITLIKEYQALRRIADVLGYTHFSMLVGTIEKLFPITSWISNNGNTVAEYSDFEEWAMDVNPEELFEAMMKTEWHK